MLGRFRVNGTRHRPAPATPAYVTRFRVLAKYLSRYEVHSVGGSRYQEYWIPDEDLPEFNANIVGLIEVIAEYRGRGRRKESHG